MLSSLSAQCDRPTYPWPNQDSRPEAVLAKKASFFCTHLVAIFIHSTHNFPHKCGLLPLLYLSTENLECQMVVWKFWMPDGPLKIGMPDGLFRHQFFFEVKAAVAVLFTPNLVMLDFCLCFVVQMFRFQELLEISHNGPLSSIYQLPMVNFDDSMNIEL